MPPIGWKFYEDPSQRFESCFAINRTFVEVFCRRIWSVQTGGVGITYDTLQLLFITPAWQEDFTQHEDRLLTLLEHLPSSQNNCYDKMSLSMLGLLWCAGDEYTKTLMLLDYVLPPGFHGNLLL